MPQKMTANFYSEQFLKQKTSIKNLTNAKFDFTGMTTPLK